MPSILNLKFKGNKSFVAFSNLGDVESLTKTWKVCTKVASYLEQGQRLENLSWRLWHLQNLMVDTDNAKSKREFKKLSKCMGDKLDKEKGRSIEELEAPDFKRNSSTDMIRQRAVEKERNREASQNAKPGTIKRMQFTFSVDQPTPVSSQPVKKPDLKPSPEFNKRPRAGARAPTSGADIKTDDQMVVVPDEDANDKDPPLTQRGRKSQFSDSSLTFPFDSASNDDNKNNDSHSLRFPPLFSNDFGPTALLYPSPTLTTRMNYGEGLVPSLNNDHDGFSIPRPTIELPLDELLSSVDSPRPWSPAFFASSSLSENQNGNDDEHNDNSSNAPSSNDNNNQTASNAQTFYLPATGSYLQSSDVVMQSVPITTVPGSTFAQFGATSFDTSDADDSSAADVDSDDEGSDSVDLMSTTTLSSVPPISNTITPAITTTSSAPVKEFTKPALPSKGNLATTKATSFAGARSNTPRPHLTVRTSGSISSRTSSVPSATATSLNSSVLKSGGGAASLNNNSAPGGQKAECSNCGATHTPLWRRGLNDELNCNACGLYCKLHKRPRPKTMRNTHGEGRTQSTPRQETVEVMAQCYNCHTTATPLWRKDDEGKTVCNACGLYYKLHGSARPISMKSDVIRKRSRHDARRAANGTIAETPSASPGVSRRASPARETSPTLAPDSSTATPQVSYDYSSGAMSSAEETDFHSGTQSELLGALGPDTAQNNNSAGAGAPGVNATGAPAGAPNASLYQNIFNFQFPGPYHPDHLHQHLFTPMDQLPFASVELDVDLSMSPRTSKRRRMSTDSASEPPSSAVSYSSFTDGYSTTSSATSHSQRSSVSLSSEFPFSTFPSASTPTSYTPNQVFRGGATANAFWHPPMMVQENDTHGFHPPMLPPSTSGTEDSPMDYLHPPLMQNHDDDALFSTYLHPPMSLPDESGSNGNVSGANERSGSNGNGNGGGNNGNNNHYYVSQDYGTDMRIY